jgi:hypothetical protein
MNSVVLSPAPRPVLGALHALPADWLQWVAENRLSNCTPASMVEGMVAAGLDRDLSEQALLDIERDPVFIAARRQQQLQVKLESVVGNLQQLWQSQPGHDCIERRPNMSRDEFIERYVTGCWPVVLQGVADDWPALQRWSPADLKARFGHLDVDVQMGREADPHFEANKLMHRQKVLLGDYVDRVLQGGPTNDHYLTANSEILRRPEFKALLDDIGSLPALCDRSLLPGAASFWFGPAGTRTPLHHDTLMLFHTQVVGRKRWRFVSPLQTPLLYNRNNVFSPVDLERPDLDRYPRAAQARVLETVVEPGETIFLPLGWWHEVASLDVSLSFSYTNLTVPNEFNFVNPALGND